MTMSARPAALFALLLASAVPAQAPAQLVVEATVVDERGLPIEGAAFGCGASDSITTAGVLAGPMATSGPGGRLRCEVVAAAEMGLIVARGRTCMQVDLTHPVVGRVDLGLVVLRPAVTLRGLVRGPEGPVEGARVQASDVFRSGHLALKTGEAYAAFATTDGRGRFRLEGVPAAGAAVRITAAGLQDFALQHATSFEPVVATLPRAAEAAGVVRDAGGAAAAGAHVRAFFERSASTVEAVTDPSGRFSLSLRHPGRYRLRAQGNGPRPAETWSGVLTGGRDDVRLALPEPPVDVAPGTGVEVRATRKADGAPVTRFSAAAAWLDPSAWKANPSLLNKMFAGVARSADGAGVCLLPGPGTGQPSTCRVLVRAPGYAPAVVTDVTADQRVRVDVVLVPEAVVSGVVTAGDPAAPVRGARVEVEKGNGGPSEAVTDAAGRYRIGGLEAGRHKVVARYPGHPDSAARFVTLEQGAETTGADVTMPRGATIAGEIAGAQPGWQVRLDREQVEQVIFLPVSHLAGTEEKPAVRIGPGGVFRFTAVADGRFKLVLLVPYALGTVEVPLDDVTVKGGADVRTAVDLDGRLPAQLRGRVRIEGVAMPPGRLLVVAEREDVAQHGWGLGPMRRRPDGTRALVGQDGQFALPARPGRHRVLLVDLATGVELYRSGWVQLGSGAAVEHDVTAKLGLVRVSLAPTAEGGRLVADRIEVVVPDEDPARQEFVRLVRAGGVSFDSGVGFDLSPDATGFDVILPARSVHLQARTHAHQLDPKKTAHHTPQLGELEVQAEPGKTTRRQLHCGEPQVDTGGGR